MRNDALAALRRKPDVSVLIIGAGINGCGVFRDLAYQNVDALLVDQGDFCSGASAASSHLIHGGLRYLEYGDFALVREAVQERNRLLANAPHYVKPLPTRIPLFSRSSGLLNAALRGLGWPRPTRPRGAWTVRLGLRFYDAFSRRVANRLPRSTQVPRRASLETFPALNPDIIGTAQYYDAAVLHPERLALGLIQDGLRQQPASRALNYVKVASLDAAGVRLQDLESGAEFAVKPRLIVNAAGPWIDRVNRALSRPTGYIGGTKGSHLVVAHDELGRALQGHMFFFENADGRIVLICPFHHRVLIGTTDIRVDSPDDVVCTAAEEAYLLAMTRQAFPRIAVSARDVVFRYSGVRPLGAATGPAGAISRNHQLRRLAAQPPLPVIYSMIGGKWTTFRAFAEQAADAALQELQQPRLCATRDLALSSGPSLRPGRQDETAADLGLSRAQYDRLLRRFGPISDELAAYLTQQAEPGVEIADSGYLRAEVEFMSRREMVVHLDDLVCRRTLAAMLGELTPARLEALADVVASACGWPAQRKTQELQRTRRLLRVRHGVSL